MEPINWFRQDRSRRVEDAQRQFPNADVWTLRQAFRDASRDVLSKGIAEDEAKLSQFIGSELSPTARAIVRAGGLRPLVLQMPDYELPAPFLSRGDYETVVVNDAHFGSDGHSPHAVDLVKQIVEAIRPAAGIFNGDMLDVHSLSRFTPSAEKPMRWAEERRTALPHLAGLVHSFGDAEITWHFGNHEDRPDKYMAERCPQLQGLFDTRTLLGIDNFNFIYPENNRTIVAGQVLVKHGTTVSQNAGQSVTREVLAHGMSVIMGHVHRDAYVAVTKTVQRVFGEPEWFGIENGCLANLEPDYGVRENTANWQHSAVVLTEYDSCRLVVPEFIKIHGRYAFFRGHMFTSRIP